MITKRGQKGQDLDMATNRKKTTAPTPDPESDKETTTSQGEVQQGPHCSLCDKQTFEGGEDFVCDECARERKQIEVTGTIRVNAYAVVSDAIEMAIDGGIRRAFKHTSTPDHQTIRSCIYEYVTNALCEVLKFDD